MKKIKSVLRSSMAQERMYILALLNIEQDIVHKMDFTYIIDLFTAAKTRKKTKIFIFQHLRVLHFQKVIYEYKAKVSSRTGGP